MDRDLAPEMQAGLEAKLFAPCFLVMLELRSKAEYVWTGSGDIVMDAMTFTGIGNVGEIGVMKESSDVRAEGMTLGLSGVDQDLLGETLTDVFVGGAAKVWFGLCAPGGGLIAAKLIYSGTVDEPTIVPKLDEFTIQLKLEGRILNLQRATGRRYTAADQHIEYPDDTAFNRVELINNLALRWGY